METKTFYNLQCPSTEGGQITLADIDAVIEMIKQDLETNLEEGAQFTVTPVQMTQEEFDNLLEFQF